jgi:4,5:9,10-diseco-3-hydroxy-5,9,17-trioxoandrosta-1(10),2-diene-4-oate hydrolase
MSKPMPIPEGAYFTTPSGYTIHYHEAGQRSAGRPSVLFLHGSGPGASGYSNFKENFPVFAEAGYHSLAIDYPGYGYASKPNDIEYSREFYVQQLHEFVVGQGITQVVPVGNSLGGLLATAFTLAHPHLVPKLILMAPGGMAEGSTYIPYQVGLHEMFKWVAERPTDLPTFRRLLSFLVSEQDKLTEAAVHERFEIALSQPSEVWTRMNVGHLTEQLPNLKCPVLCFWGARDRFVPVEHAHILLDRAPDVRLIVSNRCGHWYQIEQTEDFNRQSIAFLDGAD